MLTRMSGPEDTGSGYRKDAIHTLSYTPPPEAFMRSIKAADGSGLRDRAYFEAKLIELRLLLNSCYNKNELHLFARPATGKDMEFLYI